MSKTAKLINQSTGLYLATFDAESRANAFKDLIIELTENMMVSFPEIDYVMEGLVVRLVNLTMIQLAKKIQVGKNVQHPAYFAKCVGEMIVNLTHVPKKRKPRVAIAIPNKNEKRPNRTGMKG